MEEFRTLAPCCMLSPVPAVMVSCRGVQPGDKPNIVTIAWAGTVNTNPPMVSISVQKKRFSYEMIRDSGEFVVNLVDEAHCKALDYCGVKSGRDVDKWAETGRPHGRPRHAVCPRHCGVPGLSQLQGAAGAVPGQP